MVRQLTCHMEKISPETRQMYGQACLALQQLVGSHRMPVNISDTMDLLGRVSLFRHLALPCDERTIISGHWFCFLDGL